MGKFWKVISDWNQICNAKTELPTVWRTAERGREQHIGSCCTSIREASVLD